MGQDDAKRIILARRARFVLAAVAGLRAASGCSSPEPCLSLATDDRDAGGDAGDAGRVDGGDGGTKDAAGPNDASPQPCLVPPFDGG